MLSRPEELTGAFNSHLKKAFLVISEESVFGGDKKGTGFLKHFITSTELNINEKYKELVTVKSHANTLFISNSAWVLPVQAQERRYAIFPVAGTYAGINPDEGTRDYFNTLANLNPYYVAYWLYHIVDISTWEPRSTLPVTFATAEQKISSFNTAQLYTLEVLQSANDITWPLLAKRSLEEWFVDYTNWCDRHAVRSHYQRMSMEKFTKEWILFTGTRRNGHGVFTIAPFLSSVRAVFTAAVELPRFPGLGEIAIEEKKLTYESDCEELEMVHQPDYLAPPKRHRVLEDENSLVGNQQASINQWEEEDDDPLTGGMDLEEVAKKTRRYR